MSGWTSESVRRRQRWFPRLAAAIAAVFGGGFLAADLGLLPPLLAIALTVATLLALTIAATCLTTVSPRGSTVALGGAVLASMVLRPLTNLAVTALGSHPIVVVLAVAVTVAPFLAVAIVYARRLR